MSTIQELFQLSQQAEAAYANFIDPDTGLVYTDVEDIEDALRDDDNNMRFSESQAEGFVTHWRVVDQYDNPSGTGFSATLFESIDNPGQYSLAIRGSQETNDFIEDAELIALTGIAINQVIDMYNYWQRINTAEGEIYTAARRTIGLDSQGQIVPTVEFIDSSLLENDEQKFGIGVLGSVPSSISVSGHSLGGHLAMAFAAINPDLETEVVSVNGLGFKLGSSIVNEIILSLGGDATFSNPNINIQSIFGIDGLEFAAMDNLLLQQPSDNDGIYIESTSLLEPIYGGHGISQMTDSLAVYNLLATLDTNLNTDGLEEITSILEASTSNPENSLESILGELRTLFLQNYAGSNVNLNDAQIAVDDREQLHASLDQLHEYLIGSPFNTGTAAEPSYSFTITSLGNSGSTAESLVSEQKMGSENNFL